MLSLAPDELAGVIEALYDAILRRMRWSTYKSLEYKAWRELPLETVQTVLDNLISGYIKAVMLYKESDYVAKAFEKSFVFDNELWDLLTSITVAKEWKDIEYHEVHTKDCVICATVFGN